MTVERLLTTQEVARRLGVKKTTVYAYVSRGLLASRRNADGKESLFAEDEVASFMATRRRSGTGAGEAPAVQTGITLITADDLFYRGHRVRALATSASFESVVTLLWTGSLEDVPLDSEPALRELAEAVTAPLPEATRTADRLRVIVAAIAAADRLRFDTAPAAVTATGRKILGAMVAALPIRTHPADPPTRGRAVPTHRPGGPTTSARGSGDPAARARESGELAASARGSGDPAASGGGSGELAASARGSGELAVSDLPHRFAFASALWARLTTREPTPAGVNALNAALVLLADHDLAASTFAARVAASTRAHPYAVVGAGLAALDGPRHGGASTQVSGLLADAVRSGDPVGTISDRLRVDGWVPGFGHPLYPSGDPRAATLLGLLDGLPAEDGRAAAHLAALAAAMRRHSGAAPNIDFALASLAVRAGMDADAGEVIFAVARTAGWIAHALEEYGDEPSRFRPSGRYEGLAPPSLT